jgi:PAS domain S-box-containing protein
MADQDPKIRTLQQQGTLNPRPKTVRDELFLQDDFFDPRDLVPEPLFCCDIEGWILWLNRAAEQLLGRAAHELIGHTFAQLFPPEDRSRSALHVVRQHWRGAKESYWETTLISASGRPHWVGLRLRLLRASNGSMVYVCSAHDLQAVHLELEELRHKLQVMTVRADEVAAAAELKSDFLATTSQELRIPMSGIIGGSRCLSRVEQIQRMSVERYPACPESLGLVDDASTIRESGR